MDMLTAMYFAHLEVYEDGAATPHGASRPFVQHGATTWLKYVTLHYRPVVPPALSKFLEDCHNRDAVIATYQKSPTSYAEVVKLPLPLGSAEAFLFAASEALTFDTLIDNTRSVLADIAPGEQIGRLAAHTAQLPALPLPMSIINRIERYLTAAEVERLVLKLACVTEPITATSQNTEPSATPTEETKHA
jgi:hypothetical protein